MKTLLLGCLFLMASCTTMDITGYAIDMVEWVSSNHHTYSATKLPTLDGNWYNSFPKGYLAYEYLTIYVAKDREAGVPLEDELLRLKEACVPGTPPATIRSIQQIAYQVYADEVSVQRAESIYGESS